MAFDYFKRLFGIVGPGIEDKMTANAELIREAEQNAELGLAYSPDAPLLEDVRLRRLMYRLWWSYFDNSVYLSIHDGGYRKLINEFLGAARTGNLAGHFNPVERAVRAYELVFDGSFGDDIRIDDNVSEGVPVNNALLAPVKKIWTWSNIDQWKNLMLNRTAGLGTTGLRINFRDNTNPALRKIYFTTEHPSLIRNLETDERGNVTQVLLEYSRLEGNFYDPDNPRQRHDYLEYMSRDEFWMQRDGQWWNYKLKKEVKTKAEATVRNVLGIVPWGVIRQNDLGGDFGLPCFSGNERKMDHLNALASHINAQIRKHVTVTWLIEAGGPKPEIIPMGDMVAWYVQKELGSTSSAKATPLVANLNIGEAINQQKALLEEITHSMPELKATDGAFLSHQSGSGVAHLRMPAEQRILTARESIESGLIRMQKIALSLGVMKRMWDLGTGMGTKAAADRAYEEGYEDHRFNERPALPLTIDDQLTAAKASATEAGAESPGGNNVNQPADNAGVELNQTLDDTSDAVASQGA
jgi:hypothetical protein